LKEFIEFGKYVGLLPVYIGRSRKKTFQYLPDRIWKGIQGWQEKIVPKAGKDILIKGGGTSHPHLCCALF
jgi:hypothetical protein